MCLFLSAIGFVDLGCGLRVAALVPNVKIAGYEVGSPISSGFGSPQMLHVRDDLIGLSGIEAGKLQAKKHLTEPYFLCDSSVSFAVPA
jgi:hypothetical protein